MVSLGVVLGHILDKVNTGLGDIYSSAIPG